MIKVLNLYAGIGGNRKLWEDVEVTAVELNPDIAKIYQDFFPDDTMIITDAHSYLLEHFKEYDFIWSSPPCPTHSVMNNFLNAQGVIRYPDMNLYQEIVFLKQFFDGLYCVENVVSYYDPLIKPFLLGRHYFWSNFYITDLRVNYNGISVTNSRASTRRNKKDHIESLKRLYGIDCDDVQLLANCVYPPLGKHILDCARGNTQKSLMEFRTKTYCAEEEK